MSRLPPDRSERGGRARLSTVLRVSRRAPRLAVSGSILMAVVVAAGLIGTRELGRRSSPVGSGIATAVSASPAKRVAASSPLPTAAPVGLISEPSSRMPAVGQPTPGPGSDGGTLCRLPLDRGGSGAFLSVPTAGVQNAMIPYRQPVPDPDGHPMLPDGEDPADVSYTWALTKWLPVRQEWVAPDGMRYAYSDRLGALHVVDARISQDRLVNGSKVWSVIAFRPEGVYAAVRGGSTAAAGLWRIDPNSGTVRQLQADGAWRYVSPGAAWALTTTPPSVPPPFWYTPQFGPFGNTLVRLDLATNQQATLYVRTDTEFRLLGVDDQGDPAIADLHYVVSPLIIVTAPGRFLSVGSGSWVNAAVDGGRTWFGENYGPSVWLKDSAGIRAVVGPGSGQVRVAGACR